MPSVPPESYYGYSCTNVRPSTWHEQCTVSYQEQSLYNNFFLIFLKGTNRTRNYVAYYEAVARENERWKDAAFDFWHSHHMMWFRGGYYLGN